MVENVTSIVCFSILKQARIQQKEETIAKYQELLKQARDDMLEMNRRHDNDLKNMQQKIHMNTDAAFNKFKDAARELMSKQTAHPLTTKQVLTLLLHFVSSIF